MVATIYLTILMSFERFWTLTKSGPIKPLVFWLMYCATILFAFIFNIPKFLEFNLEIGSETMLGSIPLYKEIYITWIQLIFTCFVPLITLIILNGISLKKISEIERNRKEDQEELIFDTKFNFLIVLWLFVGHTCRWIMNFYELHHGMELRNPEIHRYIWITNCVYASNVLLTLRSSLNFYIYIGLKM